MKVTLSGPRGEEKEELFNTLKMCAPFTIVEDPKRYISELDKSSLIHFEEGGQDWLNLWTAVTRRIEVIRTSQLDEDANILTDTWALDDLMLQAVWLSYQMEVLQNSPQLLDVTGAPVIAQKQALANRSGSTVQLLLNQTEEEAMEVYDYIYLKLPFTMDPLVEQYIDFVKSIPALQNTVIELPQSIDKAKDFLIEESKKWNNE